MLRVGAAGSPGLEMSGRGPGFSKGETASFSTNAGVAGRQVAGDLTPGTIGISELCR